MTVGLQYKHISTITIDGMGIPSYFSHIIKNYSYILCSMITVLQKSNIDHVYLDCNSLIYDAYYSIEKREDFPTLSVERLENEIIEQVQDRLEVLFGMLNPTKTIFIAFDGVAPYAKMKQQKSRRFKSHFFSTIHDKNSSIKWSTAHITPGTEFMKKLSKSIKQSFEHQEQKFNVEKMIVSTSHDPGEGEHKMFQYIRSQKNTENDTAAVYGLDSDLIMLSVFHCKQFRNFYVFREATEFVKTALPVDLFANLNSTNDPSIPYFMDILVLSSSILREMSCLHSEERRIYDYVFLCFFLGNDFLPGFSSLNIRTVGIETLMTSYRNILGKVPGMFLLTDELEIDCKNLKKFLKSLAENERGRMIDEYQLRKKWDYVKWDENDKENLIKNVPVIYRAEEHYIYPKEKGWDTRYYKVNFETQDIDIRKRVSLDYMRMLSWVLLYYVKGCEDWRLAYEYHECPLIVDLLSIDFSAERSKKERRSPFTEEEQLVYVTPDGCKGVLPKALEKDNVVQNIKCKWNNKRYAWEGWYGYSSV